MTANRGEERRREKVIPVTCKIRSFCFPGRHHSNNLKSNVADYVVNRLQICRETLVQVTQNSFLCTFILALRQVDLLGSSHVKYSTWLWDQGIFGNEVHF